MQVGVVIKTTKDDRQNCNFMQHISRTSSFLPCPEVISLFMAKLDMAKHIGLQKRNAKIYFKRHKKNLHSQLVIFAISSFSIIDKSLQLIRNAGSITKTHSHSRLLGIWKIVLSCGSLSRKRRKKKSPEIGSVLVTAMLWFFGKSD